MYAIRSYYDGATALLAEAESFLRRHNYLHSLPGVVDLQVIVLLQQGDLVRAAALAGQHQLPKSQARVLLAQGDPVITSYSIHYTKLYEDIKRPSS